MAFALAHLCAHSAVSSGRAHMSMGWHACGIASALSGGLGIALGTHSDHSAIARQRQHRKARMLEALENEGH